VAVLVASFYVEAYLTQGGSVLTPAKLIGALAVGAWFLAWGVGRQELLIDPLFWPLTGLGAWIVLSTATSYDPSIAAVVASRYLMFFALAFLVVQAIGGSLRRAVALVDVAVAAGTVAAVLGLVNFFVGAGVQRASGPILDPNDFAFLLAVTVPLAIYRIRSATERWRRLLGIVGLLTMLAAMLATLSRGGFLGLLVPAVWALATRRLTVRWAVLAIVAIAVIVLVASWLTPAKLDTALEQKQHVAGENVESRLVAWRVALAEFGSAPLLGVGPGNYETRFVEFGLPAGSSDGGIVTTHNAFLNVLAELGGPGLALFLIYLLMSWWRLRRRSPDPAVDALRSALAAGFLAAIVGSLFLTEQYYAPLWLLPALGATIERSDP
ncbi:MAG TPA: O-antigen ligase family protein, partial [Actinomycetota bacterium]|nr:O-antigen ligase family protein [Actinomycetota bacterium]